MCRPLTRIRSSADSTGMAAVTTLRSKDRTAGHIARDNLVLNNVVAQQRSSRPPTDLLTVNGAQLDFLTQEHTKTLEAAAQLRSAIERLRPPVSDPPRDAEGEMQIGLTRLRIPPERVHVAEVPQHFELPGLRTDTTTLVKSGKGRIQITLEIPFNGDDAINTQLREIIAQFRSYPYVPVISAYLARIIQPKVQRPLPKEQAADLATRRQEAAGKVADAKIDFLTRLGELLIQHPSLNAILTTNPSFSTDFTAAKTQLSKIITIDEITAAFVTMQQLLQRASVLARTPATVALAVNETIKKMNVHIEELTVAIVDLERLEFQELHATIGGLMDPAGGVIPCCLDSIQVRSVPNQPGLLRASVSLVYFNPVPYGGVLAYRDILGDATTDPSQAIYMREQIRRWLTVPTPPALPHARTDRTSPTPREDLSERSLNTIGLGLLDSKLQSSSDGGLLIGYATADIVAEDPAQTQQRRQNTDIDIASRLRAQAPRWRTLDLSTNRQGVAVRYVSVSLGNRLAAHPIPGEFYPSMQYLGARPGRVTVELAVTNQEVLSEIHAMKLSNQQLSTLAIRHWRRPEVHLRNGVINLFGIWTAQIDDIVTESVSPNTTSVRISFIEHRVDPHSEAISRSTLFSHALLKKALRFLFTHAQRHLHGAIQRLLADEIGAAKTEAEIEALVDDLSRFRVAAGLPGLTAGELTRALEATNPPVRAHEQAASDILFGSEDKKEKGILTEKILRDAFFLSDKTQHGAQQLIATKVMAAHRFFLISPDAEEVKRAGSQGRAVARQILQNYRGRLPNLKDREQEHRPRGKAVSKVSKDGRLRTISPFSTFAPHRPTDDEIDYLVGHLVRSSGNITDEIEISDENPDQINITSRTGDDKTDDFLAITRLTRAILHDEVQPPGEESLRTIVLGAQTTIQDFLSSIRDFPSLLYRDLGLRTYQEVLHPLFQAIEAHRTQTNDNQRREIRSVRDLTKVERVVLSRFIPTYRQVGQVHKTEEESLDDFAYDLTDPVLPDFPYFSRNRTALIASLREEVERRAQEGDGNLKRKRENGVLPGMPHDPLPQRRNQEFFSDAQIGRTEPPATSTGTDVKSIMFENNDVLLTEAYAPGRFRANVQDFGVDTPQVAREIFDAAVAGEEDAHLSLRKCFPTFRVFFIEDDTKEGAWRAIDDVYGFNAVISLSVTRDKYNPDLAVLDLMNLEGNLEYDQFSTAQRDTPEGQLKSNPRAAGGVSGKNPRGVTEIAGPVEGTTGERLLRKFPLREGTRIAIQLGYHSRPDYLVTVFTGKIAEVQMGDQIHIVAQSYLQELLYPVGANPATETPAGLIEQMLNSPTVEHFGRWTPFSFEKLSAIEMHNAAANSSLASAIRDDLGIFFADPKLRNVFVAKYSTWWSRVAGQRLFESDWDVGGGQKTAWDVIQEVINYSPGWIAAVVPYDLEATLFVGRPEQPYFWTDGLRKEEQRYLRTRARRELRQGRDAGVLLNDFQKSREWHGDVRGEQALLHQATTRKLSTHEEIRSLGWAYPAWTLVLESKDPEAYLGRPTRGTVTASVRLGNVRADLDTLSRLPAGQFLGDLLRTVESNNVEYADIAAVMLKAVQGGDSILQGGAPDSAINRRLFDLTGVAGALMGVPDNASESPITFYNEIWNGERVTKERIDRAIKSRAGMFKEQQARNVNLDLLAHFLYTKRAFIPIFFRGLLAYFNRDPLTSLTKTIQSRTRKWPLNPRMRPFRQYHLISSYEDLIENQIACTRGAMWNGVQISKGEGTPLEIWADDGIVSGDRILMAFNEPNADIDLYNITSLTVPEGDFVANQYIVGVSRLAQGLRPMYRGQLVCRGRPDIKPWDICQVADYYNLIFGPVEVERVTHHFSAETGFITTITPHLVSIANNHLDCFQIMKAGWLFGGTAATGVVVLGAVATGLLVLTGVGALAAIGIGLGAAAAGKVVSDEVLTEITGKDVIGNFMGLGRHGGLKLPVKIIPLMRMGTPWVAGLRGFGRDPKHGVDEVIGLVYERLKGKAADVGQALKFFVQQINDTRSGLDRLQKMREENPNFGQ